MDAVWRPVMAFIYSILVVFDYLVRPSLNLWMARRVDISDIVSAVRDLDPTVAVRVVDRTMSTEFLPPVLPEFVHLTFGAILGIAAFRAVRPSK